jgi:hypothetical protein
MRRTLIVRLHPTLEQAEILTTTLEQYTACFNAVAAEGFTTGCSNRVTLHQRTYYPLRAQYPTLPAQLVCSACAKATEAVTSALTWKHKREQAYADAVKRASEQGKAPRPSGPFAAPTVR